jgi:hypothetical protein
MWKAILAGTAALAIAGSSLVYAQQRTDARQARWQPSQEDIAAFAAARIAALKAGLVLTPEQEKNWPAFESAFNDLSRYRMERRTQRRGGRPSENPTERLRERADALSEYSAILKKLADAQGPLYDSLDEAQKRRFAILLEVTRPRHRWHRHGMWRTMQRSQRGPAGYDRGRDWRGEHGRGFDDRRWRGRSDREEGDMRRDRSGEVGQGESL